MTTMWWQKVQVAHCGALIRQGKPLWSFHYRSRILSELDAQLQRLIEEDDDLVDVEDAVDVLRATEKAVKWCQGEIEELQPPRTSGGLIEW